MSGRNRACAFSFWLSLLCVCVSHPTPSERFALVHAPPVAPDQAEADDEAPAWSLFTDPGALQHSMTAQVRENVRANYGLEIVAPA